VSMDRNTLLNDYTILELPEDASWSEIRKSYLNLKQLYSSPSLATESLNEDLLAERGEKILKEIKEAYKRLEEHYKDIRLKNEKKIENIIEKIEFFDGSTLKQVRGELNIDLLDISLSSKIQIVHLENIEDEIYSNLPGDVYLKGYLRSYAQYISLDPEKVVEDYMQRYEEWRQESSMGSSSNQVCNSAKK